MTLKNYFRQLFGFQRGHIFFLPIFFAALYGFIRKFFGSYAKIEILFSLSLLLVYPVFIGIRPITWTGGHTFGSRYIIPTLPFMMLGVAFAISYMNRTFLFTICFFTACMNIFGVFSGTIPHGEGLTYLIRKHIQEFPMSPPFLIDRTLFPFYLAKFFVCAFFLLLSWKWGWKRITFNGAFGTTVRSLKQKSQFEENP
jgi:hypothetical protein